MPFRITFGIVALGFAVFAGPFEAAPLDSSVRQATSCPAGAGSTVIAEEPAKKARPSNPA